MIAVIDSLDTSGTPDTMWVTPTVYDVIPIDTNAITELSGDLDDGAVNGDPVVTSTIANGLRLTMHFRRR
jgi:hypothetical protein